MSTIRDEAEHGQEEQSPAGESENASLGSNSKDHTRAEFMDPTLEGAQALHENEEDQTNLDSTGVINTSFLGYPRYSKDEEDSDSQDLKLESRPVVRKPSSANGSLSTPDDTPSVQGSLASSLGKQARSVRSRVSPNPSLRPFDRRLQARIAVSPSGTPRAHSPAFLNSHSRQPSQSSQLVRKPGDVDPPQAPWEVLRWTKLRKITGQAFSEIGKRNFGWSTCISVAAFIALGTSKGIILVFDYHQNLKAIIGPGTRAVESGPVTSVALSADHSSIAGGHARGDVFTWEISKPAKPFIHVVPIDRSTMQGNEADGHVQGVAVIHVGFLGARDNAVVSADDKGMAFCHISSRGLSVVARTVRTTRILGRYPDKAAISSRPRKPSSILAFSPLPLGSAEHPTDAMGLVAMLTPYLLVILSTTPIAQTQFKATRPKELAAHGAMSAALAWFPVVKLKSKGSSSETASKAKLAYSWSNILIVLEIDDMELSSLDAKNGPSSLHFKSRSRWKAEEAIVAVQWLSRSVLGVLTITQQLIILEDIRFQVTDSSDLLRKQIYHGDLFSRQLGLLVDQVEQEDASLHGVVADAFYMSFRAYKGRIFLLGFNDVSMGTLSNWADRLLALMEDGSFIGAIILATSYFNGDSDKVSVGLPEEDAPRHALVQEKLLEMMAASLKYAFGKNKEARTTQVESSQLEELVKACFKACISLDDLDFLFEEVYAWYEDEQVQSIFLETLETHINNEEIRIIPPPVLKDLVGYYSDEGWGNRLEEMLCHLDPRTMDIDQITTLCKHNKLYDALIYVWNQALGDYTTILIYFLGLIESNRKTSQVDAAGATKIFPYLSYILTSRIYPVGKDMDNDSAVRAQAEIYHFFFSGNSDSKMPVGADRKSTSSFDNLCKILDFDAPNFLSTLNEAFEDNFLNGSPDRIDETAYQNLTDGQRSGISLNRQNIVSILLDVMVLPRYEPEDTIYLDMFIARNLPKFPQFILLSGAVLHRVLVGLCNYPTDDIADDCQLSVEYLLSMYHPPDLALLMPLFEEAHFYRVLKSVFKAERQYAQLLATCFKDSENPEASFECITDCLRPQASLSAKEVKDVRNVIIGHAAELLGADVIKAASTLEDNAPDLHSVMLGVLRDDEHAQFQYLQTIFEPARVGLDRVQSYLPSYESTFIEQYVRLLCDHDPQHVGDYVEHLKFADLRLEEILPSLERSGAIDAAVMLMARGGRVQEAIDRLTQYLGTLEAALLGLLHGAIESPDAANTEEAIEDLVNSVQKYTRVGIWLCQNLAKSAREGNSTTDHMESSKSLGLELSLAEEIWLELVDAVVRVTKNVTSILEPLSGDNTTHSSRMRQNPSHKTLANNLRTIVQETFTALLNSTSASQPQTHATAEAHSPSFSFLRVFRAFLSRASLTHPSLSDLRQVLGALFAAYSYEESLLALANELLDKDLFVHVAKAERGRRRGWRPLGQVCEGCGRRVWGPGAGSGVWEAWEMKEQWDARNRRLRVAERIAPRGADGRGKGKESVDNKQDVGIESEVEELGPLVIFACRHVFHRKCLEEMKTTGAGGGNDGGDDPGGGRSRSGPGPRFTCPLCV